MFPFSFCGERRGMGGGWEMHLRLLRRHGEVRFLPFVSFGFRYGFVRLRFGLGLGIFVRVRGGCLYSVNNFLHVLKIIVFYFTCLFWYYLIFPRLACEILSGAEGLELRRKPPENSI